MKTVLTLALMVATAHVSLAGEMPRLTHTRPLTPGAATLLAEAAAQSSIVRTQMETLELTDLIVYVSDRYDSTGGAPVACLNWVSAVGGQRYVIVRIAPWQTVPQERVVWLGHELQHALEIAAAPDVQDEHGLARLYRRIGWEEASGRFETDAAQDVGELVRNELAGFALRAEDAPTGPHLAAMLSPPFRPRPPEAA